MSVAETGDGGGGGAAGGSEVTVNWPGPPPPQGPSGSDCSAAFPLALLPQRNAAKSSGGGSFTLSATRRSPPW